MNGVSENGGQEEIFVCFFVSIVNKEIEEVRRGERKIESGNSDTWIIVSKTGSAEIKPFFFFFKEMGLKDKERMDLFLTISSRIEAVPAIVGNKIG